MCIKQYPLRYKPLFLKSFQVVTCIQRYVVIAFKCSMKKKRKKKVISLSTPVLYRLIPFTKATFAMAPSLDSAPDALNRIKCGMERCLQFAVRLFGHEGWHGAPDEIKLQTFFRQLTEKTAVQWDTIHVGDQLYVHVPTFLSRDSFVALLDYAEEELEVSKVFVCLDKNSQGFRELVKSFRFMGFEHAMPDFPSITSGNELISERATVSKDLHFMGYEME